MTIPTIPGSRVRARTRAVLVAVTLLVALACSQGQSPTAPTGIRPSSPAPTTPATPAPAQAATNLSITSFTVAGQFAEGQFRYWPEVTMRETTGTRSLTVTRINFLLQGAAVSAGDVRMTREMPAGGTWSFGTSSQGAEFRSSADARRASVTISFVDSTGLAGETTAEADVRPFAAGSPAAVLQIAAFTVTPWEERPGLFGYWPRLTVSNTGGTDDLIISRIKFQLLGIGAHGNVPTVFGTWRVPAGGTLNLFHELFYGEPAFFISSTRQTEEVSVTLSFVDSAGRSGDVVAVAPVTPAGTDGFRPFD